MSANNDKPVDADTVRSYAIRRVNPFLGVLQVIETAGGRAVSTNGVVWDIEIRSERASEWGSLNRNKAQVAYYRYGLWSLEDGLVTRPLAPLLDSEFFTQQCNVLTNCILARLEQLPFRLEDKRELWLFDPDDRQPLALLASAIPGNPLPSPEPRCWTSHIGANGVPSQRKFPDANALEALVKQRAGFNINTHWLTRQNDNSGLIESNNTCMSAEFFPTFLLTEDWPEAEQTELAGKYIEWISPSLLTLQHLDKQERERMESNLYVQAVSVEHHRHLYPEIIDENCISSARVQCRLQKAHQDGSTV
jgi:hypothetical protein